MALSRWFESPSLSTMSWSSPSIQEQVESGAVNHTTQPAVQEEWSCSACSFLNHPSLMVCDICTTAKSDVQMHPIEVQSAASHENQNLIIELPTLVDDASLQVSKHFI